MIPGMHPAAPPSATNARVHLHPTVAAALAAGAPVVALESTIISHGMPWPQNLETALRVEAAVREAGAVPATIAVIDGRPCAGLAPSQIETLARAGPAVRKLSRRDLPVALAAAPPGQHGATTVATTMMIAAMAGIRVFATGGIGGVHRGALSGAASFDISADLLELARTPVAVVCAGAKAILDLRATLEMLETHGVPVLGYQCSELPAFYSRESGLGLPLPWRLDTPEALARVLRAQDTCSPGQGAVIANPVPAADEIPHGVVDAWITQALAEARAQGVAGAGVTPFLLARVAELSGGASLKANIALVLNNARLAAQVAAAYVLAG